MSNSSNDNPNSPIMPAVDFSTFIMSLASSIMVHLGEIPNPDTKTVTKDTVLAKHTIDLLDMLDDKFNNGLSDVEKKMLKDILYEVRMKYITQNN